MLWQNVILIQNKLLSLTFTIEEMNLKGDFKIFRYYFHQTISASLGMKLGLL